MVTVSLVKQRAPDSQRSKCVLFHQGRVNTILGTLEVVTEVENALISPPVNRDHQKESLSAGRGASLQPSSHFKDIHLSWLSQSHRTLL